ncbi:MAG: PilZ domain-containing protein [Candidatus Omnitrophota bacterium]|nr:MAG: PilZ domain-containing protein [Candidatus Omnitrophota bacterium]
MIPEDYFGNRREHKRWPCSWMGKILLADNSFHYIKCLDASPKGVGIITQSLLPLNSYVKVEVTTPKVDTFLVEGKVCWCHKVADGFRAGICFDKALPFSFENIL